MSEQQDLEGLTALVTGATSGIGRATAEELARHGADVVVHGRDATHGQIGLANAAAYSATKGAWRR